MSLALTSTIHNKQTYPPTSVAFIPAIASTSGRLHSEFIRLLFLQTHRETDRFFAVSGVQSAQSTSGGLFHFKRAAFLTQFKAKVGSSLVKEADIRVNLNIDGTPITSVDSSTLVFSLSSYRYPYIVFVFSSLFNDS